MDLNSIQHALKAEKLDGWLFYDFHHRDPIAYRILGLSEGIHPSRRWYFFIPSEGLPQKIMSAVEAKIIESLPGDTRIYLSLEDQKAHLQAAMGSNRAIAMNYSPMNNVPYVSLVDAGTVELIHSLGYEVYSAQNLIQIFEGLVKEEAFVTHQVASEKMHRIMANAFEEIGRRLRSGTICREIDIQKFIQKQYATEGLISYGSPEVAINENAADPHYSPRSDSRPMQVGDLVLIDSWAKLNQPGSIYYDHTWMAYIGDEIPKQIQEVWEIVKKGRDAAITFEREQLSHSQPCYGWEIDNWCRKVISDAGYGKYFVHRTGHSIGQEVHGNAVHIDGLETKDTRKVGPYILHSIEPGIYMPDQKIGVRSEVDVYIDAQNNVIVTGPIQQEIVKIHI